MDNLPVHMRISSLTPTNDDVDARRHAIKELAATWGKISDVGNILNKTDEIADSLGGDGQPYEELGTEVQAAVQKHASAFLYEDSPLDVGICAGMAAVSLVSGAPGTGGWTIADVYSNGLWSALAFQTPLAEEKREKLRQEVLVAARDRSRAAADKAREREAVPDMADLTVTIGEEGKTSTNFKKAVGTTIETLRRNAALDREELDFLWWVQLNRSRLLAKPMMAMSEPVRLIAAGLEAARHLRRLPADVHYDLVTRSVDEDPELDLSELLHAIGDDRATLAAAVSTAFTSDHTAVFPLINALATGETDMDGANDKRKASTWAARALLEAGLSRMTDHGVMKL